MVFRRGHGAAEAPASPVARAVGEALRRGLDALPSLRGIVDLYDAEASMPASMREEIEALGVSGHFWGAYDPGTRRIALVAANIPSARAAQTAFVLTLLRHEGRHAGLDLILGGEAARTDYFARAARVMPRQVNAWLERNGLESSREMRAEAAEEILVSWSKDGTVHRALDRLLARIARWVRSIFPRLSLTKAELRQVLADADDFVDGKGLEYVAPLGRPAMAAPVFAPMIHKGEVLVAKMTVKDFTEKHEGNRVYSIEVMEIAKAARIREASLPVGQEWITSPQAAFFKKIRVLDSKVKAGEAGGTRLARSGALAGLPTDDRNLKGWLRDEATAQVRSILPSVREAFKETSALGKILRSPEYWKHPALKRLYEIFRDRTDRAHELLHAALDAGDGRTVVQEAKAALKDKWQREILNEGVDHADVKPRRRTMVRGQSAGPPDERRDGGFQPVPWRRAGDAATSGGAINS